MHPAVTEYINNAKKWQQELRALRNILLKCGLSESLKWRQPCYAFQNKNIAIIGSLKGYCVLSFFKGVLLNDTEELLIKPGSNSQSARYLRFKNTAEIIEQQAIIKAFISESIENEKAGVKVKFKKNPEPIPAELENIFDKNAPLKTAFYSLTPGRQRGYILYFSKPKQSKTRINRIEKYIPKILDGKGFHDCTCGHSKRLPLCDGSHKYI